MKKDWIARELTVEIVVGVFVVVVLLGLICFTFILSGADWGKEQYRFTIKFSDVMGLRERDSVVARGMPVGEVESLNLGSDTDCVEVHVVLHKKLRIREGYQAMVVSTSILGGRLLEIDEGPTENPLLKDTSVLEGKDPHDLMSDAADLVNAAKKGLAGEDGIIESLRRSTMRIDEVSDRLAKGQGTLGKLLSDDDTLYEDISAMASSFKVIARRMEDGKSTIGKLLADDDKLYRDMSEAVAALKNTAQRLDRGESTVGKLLADDGKLYNDLAEGVASLKNVAKRIENGEGMLGKLTTDEKLYEELEGVVSEIRATIEDVRETTPVTTFTSVFFGAL
jgi:phospholipid/cholesterol/gamma-HCH transport system substrate-binding protein